jgi:signal transduction histidine kinase
MNISRRSGIMESMSQAVSPTGEPAADSDQQLPAALDEARRQHDELSQRNDELSRRNDELSRRVAELEEANRTALARYGQLSQELEETNRGVVALYAELDERSAQLREASEAKSRFLANVSHELRAPVTAIMGLARLLTDPGSDPLTTEQRQQVDLLSDSARDLLALVNELLDLAKAESGRLEPRWSEVALPAFFGQLRGTLRALITRPDVTLLVDEPAEVPVLVTDEWMLAQVLRNLLTNALKFTEHGEVRLSAVPGDEPGTVRLEVADTGIGIAPEDQERVFEEFYQVPGAQQAKMRGTGLGLPYARRLTTVLGGVLTLRSRPGRGSVFSVTLPSNPSPAPAGEATGPAFTGAGVALDGGAAAADGAGVAADGPLLRRVLVVDDDEAFRVLARRALHGMADEVEEADDGLRALTLITRQRPDLVVLDLRMPEVDGLTVLEVLAADEALSDIPVVVVTATATAPGTPPTAPGTPPTALGHARAVLDKAGLTPLALAEAVRAAAATESAT